MHASELGAWRTKTCIEKVCTPAPVQVPVGGGFQVQFWVFQNPKP